MRKAVTAGMTALGIASASFALTVLNPFAASAQTQDPTTTVPAQPATPAPTTPGTPANPNHNGNCPNMGTDSTQGTSSSATPAAYHMRAARV